jgi:hypothetical protein
MCITELYPIICFRSRCAIVMRPTISMLPTTASHAIGGWAQWACARRQQRQRDLDEAVEAELLQHAGVQHRIRARRGAVAERRPGVQRPQRDEDAEAEEQQAEEVDCSESPANGFAARCSLSAIRSKLFDPARA